ncbi:MAG TPA: hypothetical protein VK974_07870 [Methylophilaceae bacterium]|nr:hypothetical protein [Methylophilaceae bacterium]
MKYFNSVMLLVLMLNSTAFAEDLPYFARMPSVKQVLADNQGADARDTAARQIVALEQLEDALISPAEGRPKGAYPSPSEARLINTYHDTLSNLHIKTLDLQTPDGKFKPATDEMRAAREAFDEILNNYRNDPAFIKQVNERYLPGVDLRGKTEPKTNIMASIKRLISSENNSAGFQPPQFVVDFLSQFPRDLVRAFAREYGELSLIGFLVFVFIGLPLLTLLAISREFKPFGISEDEPLKIKAGWSFYNIHRYTGELLGTQTISKSSTSTTTTYHGEYSQPSTQTSTSYWTEDTFFLLNIEGKERSFFTYNNQLAMRPSNIISVAWAIKKGRKEGPYFLYKNHTTEGLVWKDDALFKVLRPSRSLMFLCALIAGIVKLWYFFPALAIAWIARLLITSARVKRFKQKDSRFLMAALDTAATDCQLKQAGITQA